MAKCRNPNLVATYRPDGGRPVFFLPKKIARRLVRDEQAEWTWDRGEQGYPAEVVSQEAITLAPGGAFLQRLEDDGRDARPIPGTRGCGICGFIGKFGDQEFLERLMG